MLNSEVIDLMMSRLGERRALILRAKVVQELNAKIYELDQGPLIPWFLETRVDAATVALQDFVPVPTGFSREMEGARMKVRNSENKWIPLVKVDMEQLEFETENADPAFPEGYALKGDRFYFGPTPDLVYNYRIWVYLHSTPVTDDATTVTNKWLVEFFNYTTLSALSVIAKLHIHSDKIAAEVEKELRPAADMFYRAVEGREQANRTYLLGNSEN